MLKSWLPRFEQKGIKVVIGGGDSNASAENRSTPKGSE